MKQRDGISVVIPTLGRDQVLLETLRALLELEFRPTEFLLVDQSREHDLEAERQLAGWQDSGCIKWLRLAKPSIPHAMNVGLLAAKAPLVLFLDDDISPGPELIEAHLDAHARQPGHIIAGRVLQPWHAKQTDLPDTQPFGFNSLKRLEVQEFMGGNFSLSRTAALGLGGFDENFVRVAYRFEAEFAFRWRQSGRRIRYEPEALVHHHKADSGGTRSFGAHLTTMKPDHAVGAYYCLFRTLPLRKAAVGAVRRAWRSVITKHHLHHPWWVPLTLVAEVRGLVWAGQLAAGPPGFVKLANRATGLPNDRG